MAEFDEKLNSILSNPDAMSQIMQLAQALSGDGQSSTSSPTPPPPAAPPSTGPDPFSSLLGSADPGLILKLLPLIQELGSQKNSNARQLLYALRPYLKEEKQSNIERALQLARMVHIGKKFLSNWEGL
jgi:hypothetical protein